MGPFLKESEIRLRFAQRFDDFLTDLDEPALIVADDVVRLELGGGRQQQVAVLHGVGHDHVEADHEEIIALQVADHLIHVRGDGDGIAVVDDELMDRLDLAPLGGRVFSQKGSIQIRHVDVLLLALAQEVSPALV